MYQQGESAEDLVKCWLEQQGFKLQQKWGDEGYFTQPGYDEAYLRRFDQVVNIMYRGAGAYPAIFVAAKLREVAKVLIEHHIPGRWSTEKRTYPYLVVPLSEKLLNQLQTPAQSEEAPAVTA